MVPSPWGGCLPVFHENYGLILEGATLPRDLCEEREEYRLEFGQVGVVQPLVGLLDGQRNNTTLNVAEALAALAQADEVRDAIRCTPALRLTGHYISLSDSSSDLTSP